MITAKTKLCIIIGDPVEHSLSPEMHNAAYKELGIDDRFVYTAARVTPKDLETTISAVRAMGIRGLTCTIPHKTEVIKYLDEIDPIARKIGAVNTIVNDNGILTGYNTDWLGIVTPLEKIIDLHGKHVVVLGAGGAARAMVFGCIEKGARVSIHNRSIEKAKQLIVETGNGASILNSLEEIGKADIILNATSLGMEPHTEESPLTSAYILPKHIVFDAIYVPYETRLLEEAGKKGATIIHGLEMLLYQGIAQFEYYTGQKAPENVMKDTLLKHFNL